MEDRGSSSSYTWFYRESWVQGRFTTRAISNGFVWTISRWGILWIFENTNESLCSTIFVSQSWFTWILQTSQMGRCYHSWNEKFIGLYFLTGIIQKPEIGQYWSTNPIIRTLFFNEVMARNFKTYKPIFFSII